MKRFLVLLVVVAAVVAGAAFAIPRRAATINGSTIERQALDADLSAIAGNAGYQCYIEAGLALSGETADVFPVTGANASSTNPGTYNTTFTRYWLTEMLGNELVAQLVAARNLTVTSADLAIARVTLQHQITGVFGQFEDETGSSCGTTGAALLNSLPDSFRSEQITVQAQRDALLAHEAGFGLTAPGLRLFYARHHVEFDTVCISYVGFASESDAATAKASIAAGTPITKTGTLTPIGCGIQQSITSLPKSVTSLAVGKVSTPLSEGTGTGQYALLVVTSRKNTAFGAARTAAAQAVLAAGSAKTEALLRVADRRATVTADPRYGTVHPKTIAIAPPLSPVPTSVLNPTANLPTAPVSRSGAAGSG